MVDRQELLLLSMLAQASNSLSRKSKTSLMPYAGQITTLNDRFNLLAAKIGRNTTSTAPSSPLNYDPTLSEPPWMGAGSWIQARMSPENGQQRDNLLIRTPLIDVWQLLDCALERFQACQLHLKQLTTAWTFEWLVQDMRLLHLSYITSVTHYSKTQHLPSYDRLLLLCSCMSFATEFRDFERKNGWDAKEDLLYSSLVEERVPEVQKIGKHAKVFFEKLGVLRTDEKKLDAGLRLGTKLRVLERLGQSIGLGMFLSLLCGFELSRLSRMPYSSFVEMRKCLDTESKARTNIKRLADEYTLWWHSCQTEYHRKFVGYADLHGESPSRSYRLLENLLISRKMTDAVEGRSIQYQQTGGGQHWTCEETAIPGQLSALEETWTRHIWSVGDNNLALCSHDSLPELTFPPDFLAQGTLGQTLQL